ncbi:LacI family DNA-binding transcriptional regulator [Winogradskyella ursingii]|uniref:LacI family DNA-binding transcriptional regulator n=1 Tax=Winogradskyella ursingii TaxID=2686079 RepID=UPI0015CCB18B|nr:LacI family DNA-binding transcriptional regulator [Winogradskyella ursingii]
MTLKELAKISDVSISTVSKALNDSPEIGEKTKRRITELAKLYHYQPNNIAVNLKTGRTRTVGVVVPSIQNNFFAKVIIGIEEVLNSHNYNIIISISKESQEKEASMINTLSNGVVDGFIVAVAEETQVKQDTQHFQNLLEKKKPIVFFDRVLKNNQFDKVLVDDKTVVSNLTKQLMGEKRKGIVLVSSIFNLSVGKSRKEGYLDAIGQSQKAMVIESEVENLFSEISTLLSSKKVDAIIALDEDAALLSLKVANNLKMKFPKDISIVGFASDKLAENVSPRLTTVNQHGIDIGKTAAHILIDKLKDNTLKPKRVVINSTLDHRETS